MHEFPRIKRLPPYVFNITNELKMNARRRGEDVIDLSMGNPDGPTPQHIVDKLVEAAQRQDTHGYSVSKGIPRLRRAISAWYARRYSASFDPETEVLITMGAKEGMSHLCFAILSPGDVTIAPDPCYPIHAGGPRIAGSEVEFYSARAGLAPAEAVAQAIQRVEARGQKPKLVIANYPQNPTGRVITRDEAI